MPSPDMPRSRCAGCPYWRGARGAVVVRRISLHHHDTRLRSGSGGQANEHDGRLAEHPVHYTALAVVKAKDILDAVKQMCRGLEKAN